MADHDRCRVDGGADLVRRMECELHELVAVNLWACPGSGHDLSPDRILAERKSGMAGFASGGEPSLARLLHAAPTTDALDHALLPRHDREPEHVGKPSRGQTGAEPTCNSD